MHIYAEVRGNQYPPIVGVHDPLGDDDYLAREARARKEIDKQLAASGWKVQSQKALNVSAGPGVAVREFTLEKPHGRVDYLLFLNGQPAGVIEAKPEGTTLTEVERQSGKYVEGLPHMKRPCQALAGRRVVDHLMSVFRGVFLRTVGLPARGWRFRRDRRVRPPLAGSAR